MGEDATLEIHETSYGTTEQDVVAVQLAGHLGDARNQTGTSVAESKF